MQFQLIQKLLNSLFKLKNVKQYHIENTQDNLFVVVLKEVLFVNVIKNVLMLEVRNAHSVELKKIKNLDANL